MQRRTGRRSNERLAVLYLTHEVAEWLGPSADGGRAYARVRVLGQSAQDLVSAAVEARKGAGAARDDCVLVLGGKLVEQRVLALPEISRADVARVLPRKAANLLSVEVADALYAALPLAGDSSDEVGGGEQRWFLMAMRRSLLTSLAAALQRAQINVDRLVCGPLARLCEAQAVRADPTAACIVVDVDLDAVVVSLIQGDGLRMQNRIQGAFESAPTMALSLVQELRTFDAFWRKCSRGAGVQQVVVLGLEVERVKLFTTAVASALQGARVIVRPEDIPANESSAPRSILHRCVALAACRTPGPFALEAALPTPPRLAVVSAVAGAALLLAGSLGVVLHVRLASEAHRLRNERVAYEVDGVDLERVRSENQRTQALLGEVLAEGARLAQARELGVPLSRALATLVREIEGAAQVRSLALKREGGDGEVRFAGSCEAEPMAAVRALTSIVAALDATPEFEAAWIAPPVLQGQDADSGRLEFEGGAEWEVVP